MVALDEAVVARAGRDNFTGRLVAERHRHHPRPLAGDHREVGMAESGCPDPDQQLAFAGRIEIQLDSFKRFGLGEGGGQSHLPQNGGRGFHEWTSSFSSAQRIESGMPSGRRLSR